MLGDTYRFESVGMPPCRRWLTRAGLLPWFALAPVPGCVYAVYCCAISSEMAVRALAGAGRRARPENQAVMR
ncbi:hypothetical protein JCM12141A_08920 [Mycolicibacterium hodleri]